MDGPTQSPVRSHDAPVSADVPLVVDLDGTLVRTDTLAESLLLLARRHPLALLGLPASLARGRARFKQDLAALVAVDASGLPFTPRLLEHLRAEKRRGRRLVLATGADLRVARAVADHLGLFDAVLASDGRVNLTAMAKRERLVAEFGERGYDYAGNSARDLPVWAAARCGLVVGSAPGLERAVRQVTTVEHTFAPEPPRLATYLEAMRVHHWLKNLLLLVPLLAAHQFYHPVMLLNALAGVVSFTLAASGVYLLNDLLDLGADRQHPRKKFRALASGRIPVAHALMLLPCLWLASGLCALWLGRPFAVALGVYAALMVAYSMRLKDLAIVDAFVLAMGYLLRILAGALAVPVEVAPWLLVCSAALFFGLALLKRYAELVTLRPDLGPQARVRGYRTTDATLIAGLGAASVCVAVALLALNPIVETSGHGRWPGWMLAAMVLLWSGHMWLMAHRGNIRDDPVVFALHDPISRGFGVATIAVLLLTA